MVFFVSIVWQTAWEIKIVHILLGKNKNCMEFLFNLHKGTERKIKHVYAWNFFMLGLA